MKVLDLFSGIGGFSLGLERAGMQTAAFCEINPFCRAVLTKHWPGVPCYDDVRSVTAADLAADGIVPDVVCGGFPCQDISFAGAGAGLAGARSGLWHEMLRIIAETCPRYVIAENVSALRSRGLDVVLGGLAEIGYDAEWHCIPAAAVGAPHRRDRVWIIAYPQADAFGSDADRAGSHRTAKHFDRKVEFRYEQISVAGPVGSDVADATRLHDGVRHTGQGNGQEPEFGDGRIAPFMANAISAGQSAVRRSSQDAWGAGLGTAFCHRFSAGERGQWCAEPDVGRVADGVPARVDRLRALGNAVVPQIPELIGRAILAAKQAAA